MSRRPNLRHTYPEAIEIRAAPSRRNVPRSASLLSLAALCLAASSGTTPGSAFVPHTRHNAKRAAASYANLAARLFSSTTKKDESSESASSVVGASDDAFVKEGLESFDGSVELPEKNARQQPQPQQQQRRRRHSVDGGQIRGPAEVLVYDTSLRDGTQGESVSVSCDDKLKIAARLSAFHVDYIEAGWPGSNPKDAEFFRRAQTELDPETRSRLTAFGSTRRKGIKAEDDPQITALVDSGAPTVCIVAKSHLWQVTDIIRATPEENLDMIRDSVSYLSSSAGGSKRVFVDLEHFFDGYGFDPDYALQCCEAAAGSGARGLVLCDTNGGSMPWQVEEMTRTVVEKFPHVTVGMHAHNDCGMAVANSVVAARAGAGMIQGTINGIGERTGNADLCSIVPSLGLHVRSKMTCADGDNLQNITSLSRFVDETLNRQPVSSAPFVGASAFAHKGGLHVAAMERSPMSYQHVDPSRVGNEKRVLISELSGRQNIMGKIREVGYDLEESTASERATAILNRVKQLESIGYTFEGAEASVDLMILHATENYCPPFRVLDYSAMVFDSDLDSASRVLHMDVDSALRPEDGEKSDVTASAATARATIKVRTINMDEQSETPYVDRLEVSDGNGPVDALASALKRALVPNHPHLENLELVDYKVRILDPEHATGAATRVMIEFRDNGSKETWTTVSVDRNVISASLNALVDGFEYALVDHGCLLSDEDFE